VGLELEVECAAGFADEPTPRAFSLDGRRVQVLEVLDQWLAPDHRYFKLRGDDGARYILRHDVERGDWELRSWERA
jgi:hypothetical protein